MLRATQRVESALKLTHHYGNEAAERLAARYFGIAYSAIGYGFADVGRRASVMGLGLRAGPYRWAQFQIFHLLSLLPRVCSEVAYWALRRVGRT